MTQDEPSIVILTGAGISAESGLGTFRDAGGLWTQVRLEDVATPEGFARDPERVLAFYNARRENCRAAQPNPAHRALARLQRARPGAALIVTQNVDDLHERAGSPPDEVLHMHGRLDRTLCNFCRHAFDDDAPLSTARGCPACGVQALRPDVVWFGEVPYHLERIFAALERCDLFVSIGTSGEVHPAAGFVAHARAAGARTLELNLEPSAGARLFDKAVHGPASRIVPQWVAETLGEG
ncbi:NAD-dependent deacylase [Oceanicella actignis]|uniref:NAD-dependent deacylase n=1 Tax=Oceanicella actignis TaxID=1189325 RepID=UPI0011E82319|nr:NAD-dependent deacylase [Oceanicella actignis]TYO89165.1 NAD-dependent deacetylase [Oceanicella actignis]